MLKFSGYPCLIRGQTRGVLGGGGAPAGSQARTAALRGPARRLPEHLRPVGAGRGATEAQHQAELEGCNDARTGMPHGIPRGAMCVQRFDDSLNSAIHTTYRISLRSSSMPEPRDPLLKVVKIQVPTIRGILLLQRGLDGPSDGREPAEGTKGTHSQGLLRLVRISGHFRGVLRRVEDAVSKTGRVMILPQVHLRKPCYDFYFL
jgi:hypothetical protein